MRIHILSDLHLEFAPFQLVQLDADVIVLAGDIHTARMDLSGYEKHFPSSKLFMCSEITNSTAKRFRS